MDWEAVHRAQAAGGRYLIDRLSQSFHRILDAEEDSGLDRAERASCAGGKRDRPDGAAAISPGSPVEVLASSRFLAYSRAS
jgi:hypothetical protein